MEVKQAYILDKATTRTNKVIGMCFMRNDMYSAWKQCVITQDTDGAITYIPMGNVANPRDNTKDFRYSIICKGECK